MRYDFAEKEKNGWFLCEDTFDNMQLGKCESIFYLGNGYLGVRSATEEKYPQEMRGMFVSGTFNKFDKKEVTELPNLPDVIQMDLYLDDERLDLSHMEYEGYERVLNMRTGELVRRFTVTTQKGKRVKFIFQRVVSLKNHHIIAQKAVIAADSSISLRVKSGIEGKITNSGFQHLSVVNKRFYEEKLLQANYITTQSEVNVSMNTVHSIYADEKNITEKLVQKLEMDSRSIYVNYDIALKPHEKLSIEKISAVYTDRDFEFHDEKAIMAEYAKAALEKEADKGYGKIADESRHVWESNVWEKQDVTVESDNCMDQLAVRFAIFHMRMMTPGHDSRMNIGAKALSGEGYKGHTFWDTEMFLLPFWIYTCPKTARSLLEYRYLGLEGARRKACENGYKGAMYPWESAWITDGEVTPKFGAADVVTGKEMPIICGDLEQHITSDVAFGVWEYFMITGDEDFMIRCGYEIIFETARFWVSRAEWNDKLGRYEIRNVIGPDEYSEHADNNAYTNYMAYWNIKLAKECYEKNKDAGKSWFDSLSQKLELESDVCKWSKVLDKLYLPKADGNSILPQDDKYLTYPVIDLKKYKESATRADIIKDYNMEQLSHMQVSKQADVLMLFYIMEALFPEEVKKASFYYYEDKCLHDSSLSFSVHSIIASDLRETDMAYGFFKKAATIDLGPDMNTPKDGIHAAAMGGIWQCVVNGFAGLRMIDGRLYVRPNLPSHWKKVQFKINWKGVEMQFVIGQDIIEIMTNGGEVDLMCFDQQYLIKDKIRITYKTGKKGG